MTDVLVLCSSEISEKLSSAIILQDLESIRQKLCSYVKIFSPKSGAIWLMGNKRCENFIQIVETLSKLVIELKEKIESWKSLNVEEKFKGHPGVDYELLDSEGCLHLSVIDTYTEDSERLLFACNELHKLLCIEIDSMAPDEKNYWVNAKYIDLFEVNEEWKIRYSDGSLDQSNLEVFKSTGFFSVASSGISWSDNLLHSNLFSWVLWNIL